MLLSRRPGRVGTLLIDRSPWSDAVLVLVVLGLFLGWALTTEPIGRTATLPAGTRSAVYISIAATSGALLGFTIAALSVLLALPSGPRLKFLQGTAAWSKVPRVFVRAAWMLGLATLVFTAGIVVDDDARPCVAMEAIAIPVVTSAVLRVAASVLLLGRLVRYSFEDSRSGASAAEDE